MLFARFGRQQGRAATEALGVDRGETRGVSQGQGLSLAGGVESLESILRALVFSSYERAAPAAGAAVERVPCPCESTLARQRATRAARLPWYITTCSRWCLPYLSCCSEGACIALQRLRGGQHATRRDVLTQTPARQSSGPRGPPRHMTPEPSAPVGGWESAQEIWTAICFRTGPCYELRTSSCTCRAPADLQAVQAVAVAVHCYRYL